eukprot:GHVS01050453.1.p1 GENE.GHVS01050453.1~~GHVS01050453.1.p1  ORF type:complete len:641 (+),score=106.61 GHVS01050453.1:98-2020(+)
MITTKSYHKLLQQQHFTQPVVVALQTTQLLRLCCRFVSSITQTTTTHSSKQQPPHNIFSSSQHSIFLTTHPSSGQQQRRPFLCSSLSHNCCCCQQPYSCCLRRTFSCRGRRCLSTMATSYDLLVVGGGSGGMAAAKEAAKQGAKVMLFDFVKPSTQGTKWGLGGTCVNVGCVPKKLMHYGGLIGAMLERDAAKFGWQIPATTTDSSCSPHQLLAYKHDWQTLRETVQNHVKSLNFAYKNGLRSSGVIYTNALAKFVEPNTLEYKDKNGECVRVSGRHILVATGGRPHIPDDVIGAKELATTSDDLFSLKQTPGKTLVVGGAYIALECAGFLTELGYDVTVCVRSILLRGFDQQCAEKIGSLMAELGTKFIRPVTPKELKKLTDGRIEVSFNGSPTDTFDTVIYATGRYADTAGLDLAASGVQPQPNGKLKCVNEQTDVPTVFAVGDCVYGRPELTPVAIQAGELLAKRLFAKGTKNMNYDNVATTIFTPFEYGCCGLSEEDAIAKYGNESVETYLFEFTSLEAAAAHRMKAMATRANEFDVDCQPNCLSKLVCLIEPGRQPEEDPQKYQKVVGFHFVGPNAGEITQGMALGVTLGAKKSDFDDLVGVHPTDAESFCSLSITRRSGQSWIATGGCGGGKCG